MRALWVLGLSGLLAAGAGAVALPLRVNFQGKLLDNQKVPRNGNFNMEFRIFNQASGGTLLWGPETQSVTVNNGVFAVQLGAVATLPAEVFMAGDTYLSVTVAPDSFPDGEMSPRQRLVMSPYAYTSAQLVSNSDLRMNAGLAYSTFTTAGNLRVPAGVLASTLSAVNITASSGTFRYGVVASTFTGDGSGLTGTAPKVSQSSATAPTTLTANTETVVLNASLAPTRLDKRVLATGFVQVNRVAGSVGTCTLRLRANASGACATDSALIFAYNFTVANTASLAVPAPLIALDNPNTTAAVDYCLTLVCSAAHGYSSRSLAVYEMAP